MRTVQEFNGIDCIPNEEATKKKSICTSRSFATMATDFDTLRTHVANFAVRCAEKLRKQKTMAAVVAVFIHTNSFREDLLQYYNYRDMRLLTPSDSTTTIVQAATKCLESIFKEGYCYKKAGVIVMTSDPSQSIQPDLFEYNADQFAKLQRLDAVVDRINRVNGHETVGLGAQQYNRIDGKLTKFADAIRHDMKSKNPTTRWSDIILLK